MPTRYLKGWLGLSVLERLRARKIIEILFLKIESWSRSLLWKLGTAQQKPVLPQPVNLSIGEARGQTGQECVAGLVVPGWPTFTHQRVIKAANGCNQRAITDQHPWTVLVGAAQGTLADGFQ